MIFSFFSGRKIKNYLFFFPLLSRLLKKKMLQVLNIPLENSPTCVTCGHPFHSDLCRVVCKAMMQKWVFQNPLLASRQITFTLNYCLQQFYGKRKKTDFYVFLHAFLLLRPISTPPCRMNLICVVGVKVDASEKKRIIQKYM